MPDKEITADQLLHLIQEEELLEPGQHLLEDTDLFAQGMDSLAMMRLMILIEREFSLPVPPEEMTRERFTTAASMARWLLELRTRTTPA